MLKKTRFSQKTLNFHGRSAPEEGIIVGYGALIDFYKLPVPLPHNLAIIGKKNKNYKTSSWIVFGPKYQPAETLAAQLTFSLKYEGINLLFFKKLFEKISKKEVVKVIQQEYSGQYMRKVWFLYEWLMQDKLPIPNLRIKNFVPLLDEELQYCSAISINSGRHRIKNNLPGVPDFCPLIHKTEKLEKYIHENLSKKTNAVINNIHKDILLRTSAFLLLKDSKASFTIEGEIPTQNRAVRWGRAIGQAGSKELSKIELLRLQQIVIENSKFIKMGYRTECGFVGEHDRSTGEPIPDHITAHWRDLDVLMTGLLNAAKKMEDNLFPPVLSAAKIAFGFVFIHPFVDGNGRLHRYLIHHLLATTKFTPQGIVFPVSAAILEKINDYQKVLESYSHPLLDFIEWKKTPKNNVEVLNETIDFYRYFDATKQAEFLFDCVDDTIKNIIPNEVDYLQKYDAMKRWMDDRFQMPDKMVALLVLFLEQNKGLLSKRAKQKEFKVLTDKEAKEIEKNYKVYFEI